MPRYRRLVFWALATAVAGCEGPRGPDATVPEPTPIAANEVTYSTTATTGGLIANNVQGALDEVALRTRFALPIFCGRYENVGAGADIGGWIAARDACTTVCAASPSSARPCSVDDMVRLLRNGTYPSATDLGWVYSGFGCNGFDDGTVASTGVFWQGVTMTNRTCESDDHILCCR